MSVQGFCCSIGELAYEEPWCMVRRFSFFSRGSLPTVYTRLHFSVIVYFEFEYLYKTDYSPLVM